MKQTLIALIRSNVPALESVIRKFKLSKLPAKKFLEAPRIDGKLTSSQFGRSKVLRGIFQGYSEEELEAKLDGIDTTPAAAFLGYICQVPKDKTLKRRFGAFFLTLSCDDIPESKFATIVGNSDKWTRRPTIQEVRDVPAYSSQFMLLNSTMTPEFMKWIQANWKRFNDTVDAEAKRQQQKALEAIAK